MKNTLLSGISFGSLGILSWFSALILDKVTSCAVSTGACHPFLNNYIEFFKQIFILPFGMIGVFVGIFILWSIVGIILGLLLKNLIANHTKLLVVITIILIILIPVANSIVNNVSKSHIQSQLNREGMLRMGPDGTFIYTNGQWVKQ